MRKLNRYSDFVNHESHKRQQIRRTIGKVAAVFGVSALAFAGCKYVIGDEYPHPIAGRVDAKSEPTWECHYNAATKTNSDCDYHYYLFVNGCVELPDEIQAYVEDKAPNRGREYGWVEVSGETWSEHTEGRYIYFGGRDFIDRIFADQDDDNHTCPIE